MRTALIILGGFVLAALCLGAARLVAGETGRPAYTTAIVVFVVAWLALAAANLYVGVTQAGYTVREELPIFLAIFLVPVLAAILVRWRFL